MNASSASENRQRIYTRPERHCLALGRNQNREGNFYLASIKGNSRHRPSLSSVEASDNAARQWISISLSCLSPASTRLALFLSFDNGGGILPKFDQRIGTHDVDGWRGIVRGQTTGAPITFLHVLASLSRPATTLV